VNKYQITARHQAFGEVLFVVMAENNKEAFSAFKNIVFNHKQWIVRENSLLAGIEKDRGDRGGPGRHHDDCHCMECEI
jgi:hypothetical protein